jgi:hypothetical protein
MQTEKHKMEKDPRMLTLLTMAEQNLTLSLADLSKELEIKDSEELEEFLIDAIQSGSIKVSGFCVVLNVFLLLHVEIESI